MAEKRENGESPGAPGPWSARAVRSYQAAMRCEDLASAVGRLELRGLDLGWTRRVGAAAALATTVRGERFVTDAPALRTAVPALGGAGAPALRDVIELLDRLGVVSEVELDGDTPVAFREAVPEHLRLYQSVGELWLDGVRDERERQLVALVHRVALGPVAGPALCGELGLDPGTTAELVGLAKRASLVKELATSAGVILYSPLLTFEHPDVTFDVLVVHGPERLREELTTLRRHQGLPVSASEFPALHEAVARGLLTAPGFAGRSHDLQQFACLPNLTGTDLPDVRRVVTNKALAVLSCVRAAQRFDGALSLRSPQDVLDWLVDGAARPEEGCPTSGEGRDVMLVRARVLQCVVAGNSLMPILVGTEDNIAAVRMARELLVMGDPLEVRPGVAAEAPAVLTRPGDYLSPLQTVQQQGRDGFEDAGLEKALTVLMGRSQLEQALADVMGRTPL